jgi:hypothetical protein
MIDFLKCCLYKCSITLKFLILICTFLSVDLLAEEESDSGQKNGVSSKRITSKEDDPFGIIDEDKRDGDMESNTKETAKEQGDSSKTTSTANYDFETSEDDDSENEDSQSKDSEQNLNLKDKHNNKDKNQNKRKDTSKDTGKNSSKAIIETDNNSASSKNPINDEQFNSSRKEHKFALVSCLNKITAKSKEIKIAIGKTESCGNLEIKAIKCVTIGLRKNIFVNVTENKLNYDSEKIFGGWLISESPSISTVTHPVYELFAKSCLDSND